MKPGILIELISMVATSVFFVTLLLLWEYRLIQKFRRYVVSCFWISVKQKDSEPLTVGAARETADVQEKLAQIKSKKSKLKSSFKCNKFSYDFVHTSKQQ